MMRLLTLALPSLFVLIASAAAKAGGQANGTGVMTDTRPLTIARVSAASAAVRVFETVEISTEVEATYDNPFDPDQVAVGAEVTAPGGRKVSLPGFYYVPMRLETSGGWEHAVPTGPGGFRIRYTPTVPGSHRIVIVAASRGKTVQSKPIVVKVTRGPNPGFVRVARDSPHYFAFDSGKPYFAVGENVCWANGKTPLANYDAWFKALGAAGGNWARLWLANNEKGLEWTGPADRKPGPEGYQGLGRYAMDNAWRLDQIVQKARADGIRLMFCLGTYGQFTEGGYFNEGMWASNPYNSKNGGPCAKPADFWTNPEAKRLYKRQLRYLVARWGYSPNLFAWEFWNEVPTSREEEAWVAEMAAYLKRIDPNRHLVSNTYGGPTTWRCPDVDFVMTHMYGQAGNTADFTSRIVSDAKEGESYGKPYLLAEFGIDWQTSDTRWDPKGVGTNMHNGAWASLMSGAAGTSMLWYWDGYVHPLNVYHTLTPVRKFADTIDWTHTRFEPVSGITAESSPGVPERFTDVTVPATVEWGRPPSSVYTLRPDGSVEGGPVAMTVGSPQRANPRELYSKLTWRLDLREPTRVTLRLGTVCNAAHLVVAIDGGVKVDRELAAGEPGKGPWKSAAYLSQYKIWTSDYDEAIPLDLPAGKHVIAVSNTSGDWLQIRSLTVPSYRSTRYPNVDILGLRSDRLMLLWVHNRESTWRTDFDGKTPSTIDGLRLTVPAPKIGVWKVEWWDTLTGKVIRTDSVRASGAALPLRPPAFSRDLAARCLWE